MKLLNKIIPVFILLSICANAFAYSYNLPPATNNEIKDYANYLMKKNLPLTAEPYYKALYKRGDKDDALWGLALVNISQQNNVEALKKIDILLKNKDLDKNQLSKLKTELLINLAEESFATNKSASLSFLNAFNSMPNKPKDLELRASALRKNLEFRNNQRPIKIGVILPLSGKLSKIGEELQNSLSLALYDKDLSNITLYFKDNKSTQEGSLNAANELMQLAPNIIIGPILRDNVIAVNSVFRNYNTPIFTFSNDTSIAGNNIFINNVNLKQEAYEIAKFAYDNGNYKMACLTPDNASGDMQQESFKKTLDYLNTDSSRCVSFNSQNIDINPELKELLDINKLERARQKEIKELEKEFEVMGYAMADEKIKKLEELKKDTVLSNIDFNAIFIPSSARKIPSIAPQLAYYDVDFSNGVLFLGGSSWDNDQILSGNGEHLHFSRFLSLRTNEYKDFEKKYESTYQNSPNLLSGFAYDVLNIMSQLDQSRNFYSQIYKDNGFNVLTGNVKFDNQNRPNRVYGINKISQRSIKPVVTVKHTRAIKIPKDIELRKASGFSNWFGF